MAGVQPHRIDDELAALRAACEPGEPDPLEVAIYLEEALRIAIPDDALRSVETVLALLAVHRGSP